MKTMKPVSFDEIYSAYAAGDDSATGPFTDFIVQTCLALRPKAFDEAGEVILQVARVVREGKFDYQGEEKFRRYIRSTFRFKFKCKKRPNECEFQDDITTGTPLCRNNDAVPDITTNTTEFKMAAEVFYQRLRLSSLIRFAVNRHVHRLVLALYLDGYVASDIIDLRLPVFGDLNDPDYDRKARLNIHRYKHNAIQSIKAFIAGCGVPMDGFDLVMSWGDDAGVKSGDLGLDGVSYVSTIDPSLGRALKSRPTFTPGVISILAAHSRRIDAR